ncbi:MAG: hypothetical protein JWN63_3142 [Candidatus Acidoferrum typicum]|nr:hypothetical protein [Candidatus Acidoferrum typicum]
MTVAVAAFLQVHREYDRGGTRSFGALDDRSANFPDVCGIELLPDRAAPRGNCVFNRRSGDGGQHHEVTLGMCRPRHGDFAFRMESLLTAYGGKHNWSVPLRAEEIHRHVNIFDVDEPARVNLNPRIAFAIRPHRSVVVHAGGEIAEMRGWQSFARGRLKVHHVDGPVQVRKSLCRFAVENRASQETSSR